LEEARLRFGALQVIDNLSVRLDEGEAIGVVGPNGAGKTTMLNLLAGQLRPDSGRIRFDGQDVTAMDARRRCLLGIARTYQIPQPFSGMTVFENALVGAAFGSPGRSDGEAAEAAVAGLRQTGLIGRANRLAGSLTLLERKRLELARALATEPRLVLLDEIAGGLTEAEVPALVETVRGLVAHGVAVVWIEHVVHALVAVVTRLLCLTYGRVLAVGDPHDVLADPQVVEVYLGATIGADDPVVEET